MKIQPILSGFEAARTASDRQRLDSLTAVRSSMTLSLWLNQRLHAELEHGERIVKAANRALAELQELQG